jgi:peptidoglycan hydrolase-like protein with peptidoglycan-binding domain
MHAIAARTIRRPAALRARSTGVRSRLGQKPVSSVQRLQRSAGNHTISRVLAAAQLQREIDATLRPTLRIGSRGPAVIELQTLLNTAGASQPLAVDGDFGPMTHAAVVRFQATRGLAPDGIVGPRTWAALQGRPAQTESPSTATAAPVASASTPTSAATLIGATEGGDTLPVEFHEGTGTAGASAAAPTTTVIGPQECAQFRKECHSCCEDLHPWWRPWEFRERQSCKHDCCDFAFARCLVDGTFPCLCQA